MKNVIKFMKDVYASRKLKNTLYSMDDRSLSDIGIQRSDIEYVIQSPRISQLFSKEYKHEIYQ